MANHEKREVTMFSPEKGNQPLHAESTRPNGRCGCGSEKKQKKCCGNVSKYFTK